jgi:hypothetical protein
MNDLVEHLHQKILDAATQYRHAEAELIDLIQEVDTHRVFVRKSYASLFEYVTQALKLSESVAFNLITIARKAKEIPELKTEIRSGAITVSNARKIVPVLNTQNKTEWLIKAKTLSNRQLEKEVVKIRPMEATPERARYVAPERVKLELGLSEKDMLALRKVQDLMSQKSQRAVSLEETISVMTQDYLKKQDPVEKAKRQVIRKSPVTLQVAQPPGQRHAISKHILHQVNLRDQRRCSHEYMSGKRCNQRRWLDIHHKIPVNSGGPNTLENLTTLCSAHHQFVHLKK